MATYCQIEVNTKEIKQMIEMCTQQYRAVFFLTNHINENNKNVKHRQSVEIQEHFCETIW